MYLIELSDSDMYNIVSDSEYFTATEDGYSSEGEYFSADESFSEICHLGISSDSGSVRSVSSNSKTTSTRNHYYKRSNAKKSLQGLKPHGVLMKLNQEVNIN
ncbi:hypothetical protein [Escherichia coli]|uniref:hypothetical protein n=1 Tax=Escherichia coli TaxID=562 RepID=UPI00203AEBDA|nr:hypothetical protein [Escherichia coli]